MKVLSVVYQEFYDVWYTTLLRKEYNNEYPQSMGAQSPALLTYRPHGVKTYVTTEKFKGSRAYKPDYFYTKKIELNPANKRGGEFDSLALFKGLEYIDFYKPSNIVAWNKLKWRKKLDALYKAFMEEHGLDEDTIEGDQGGTRQIMLEQHGYQISKLSVLKEDVRRVVATKHNELYYSIKKDLLSFFSQIETEFPDLLKDEFEILELDEEEIAIYNVSTDLRSKLLKYIFDDTKSKDKRKRALTVFCHHKGISDNDIIRLFRSREQGISRLTLERLSDLVTADNNRKLLCKEVVSFASESVDVGIPRRVGAFLYSVDFVNAIKEIPLLFPAKEIGLPKHTIEGLWEYVSRNPKILKTQDIAKSVLHLAAICYNYDREHSKLKDKFTKINDLVKIRFPDLVR